MLKTLQGQFRLYFNNPYLDKLRLDEWHCYLMRLRLELALSRKELAKILGLSPHTIRKYESNWSSGRKLPPKWYEIVLRLMCGDLSTFGGQWENARIRYDSHKITSPYFSEPMNPTDMNSQYSHVSREHRQRIRDLNQQLEALQSKYDALLVSYSDLSEKLQDFEAKIAHQQAVEAAKQSGKLVDLFSRG